MTLAHSQIERQLATLQAASASCGSRRSREIIELAAGEMQAAPCEPNG